jgi:hypothetical protein
MTDDVGVCCGRVMRPSVSISGMKGRQLRAVLVRISFGCRLGQIRVVDSKAHSKIVRALKGIVWGTIFDTVS